MAIGSLAIRVSSDTTQFNRGMSGAGKTSKQFRSNLTKVEKRAAKTSLAIVGIGAAITGALIKKGLESVDAQAKLARGLDGTIAGLQGLSRAASRSGASQSELESATQKLNQRLGEAMTGSGQAAEVLDRLGLSARELASMDVDERMAALADSFADAGFNAAQTSDALRDLGIRQQSIVNLMQDGGEAIRDSRSAIKELGIEITEIDAAKVEAANDAFADIQGVASGVADKLAIEVAPAIEAVSNMFLQSIKDAGGFGSIIEKVVDSAVGGFGNFLDVLHGLRVTAKVITLAFQGLGTGIVGVASMVVEGWQRLFDMILSGIQSVVDAANRIPGVEIPTEGLVNFRRQVQASADAQVAMRDTMSDSLTQTKNELHDLAMQEMPSDKLDRYFEETKQKSQEAAEEIVAARKRVAEDIGAGAEGGEDESDKMREQMEKKLEAIREANMTEMEILQEKQAMEMELLAEARQSKLDMNYDFDQLEAEAKARHEDELSAIEEDAAKQRERVAKMEAQAKKQIMADALSGMTTLMNSESRKMFEIGKTAAIAQSLISTYQGMAKALELGFPMGPIAAAAIGVVGFANVASIKSQSFGGGGGASATGSNTTAVNAASTPTGGGGGQEQQGGSNLRVEGVSRDSLFTGEQMAETIEKVWKDGGGSGRVIFD